MMNERIVLLLCVVLLSAILLWNASRIILAGDKSTRITIICANDTLGALEPCGCGGKNTGGLSRRAAYINKVRSESPNLIIVESGDLAFAVNPSQPTAQLEAVADSFKIMGVTAVGVGPIDLKLGEDYYKVLQERGIPVVNADNSGHNNAQPYIIKRFDRIKVGIVSFGAVSPELKNDPDLLNRRYDAYKKARNESDILILLDQANIATDEWIENSRNLYGSPDIVVSGCVRIGLDDAKRIGGTMIVPSSTQGSYVGRVDIDLTGGDRNMAYTRTLINPAIEMDTDVKKIVEDYTRNQNMLVSAESNLASAELQPFYQYQSCIPCHKSQYEQWKTTRHSGALNTLVKKEKAIPDCLPCHSDMYKRVKRIAISADKIGGVECIACHSDVLPHSDGYKKKINTKSIREKCKECHTQERSPDFNMNSYYEKIRH